jgi:lipoic acid synthetase
MNIVPQWLKKRVVISDAFFETKKILADSLVNTVCESSLCPNSSECFSRKFATFLILGKVCTRACGFCSVTKGSAQPVDTKEPQRIADCVQRLGLRYVIVTSVTRDDLEDGGSGQFVKVSESVKRASKDIVLELLIPDFAGKEKSIDAIARTRADIVAHNIETIERLYPAARSGAGYHRSLDLLKTIKNINPGQLTKSAILAGLGETEEELIETMADLRYAGCDILTIGQYLRPGKENAPVDRFVTPEEFARYKKEGRKLGFKFVSSGPFVRSSYMAEENFKKEILHDNSYAAASC